MNTTPYSLIQICLAFRPSNASASRADLRSKSLTNFLIDRAFSNGFVREHISESRPTGIVDGLSKVGFAKPAGVNVANVNVRELTNNFSSGLMLAISALIGNLGVDALCEAFLVPALGLGKAFLCSTIELPRRYFFASGKGGQRFQPEVYANGPLRHFSEASSYFNNNVQIPPSLPILGKRGTVFDFSMRKRPRKKHAVCLAVTKKTVTVSANRATSNWNPSERLSSSPSKPWALGTNSIGHIAFTGLFNRVRGDSKFFTRSGYQAGKIKIGRPSPATPDRRFLRIVAIIPNEINGQRLCSKPSGVFHSVSVSQNHQEDIA